MKLQFKDKEVYLIALHQFRTYEGLIEGIPTRELNQRILEGLPARAAALTSTKACYMLAQEQVPIGIADIYPFGDPATLPPVVSITLLQYIGEDPLGFLGHSFLTLITFQNDYGLPLNQDAILHLSKLNWFEHASHVPYENF